MKQYNPRYKVTTTSDEFVLLSSTMWFTFGIPELGPKVVLYLRLPLPRDGERAVRPGEGPVHACAAAT
eukprot:3348581-Rhodomonas_salina.3